jgi:DNA replication protein DnaC
VGKTHLAVAVLRRILLERRIAAPARFVDFRALRREIKSSYHPDAPATEMDVLRPVVEAEPLVLDDLGGENPTLWVFDTIFYILNQRYNEGKLTIITTNYSDRSTPIGDDKTLSDRITKRLRSRLYEMCRDVRIEGDDYRENTLQANFTS